MLIMNRIVNYLLTIFTLTFIGSILFYTGTKLVRPFILISSGNSYLFRSSVLNEVDSALFISFVLCSLYFISVNFFKPPFFYIRMLIALFYCILFLFVGSAFIGPGGHIDLIVLKNLIVIILMALLIPFIEKELEKWIVKRKV